MKPISPKSWKLLLPCALMIGGLLPGLVAAAPPTQSFYIYGQAQVLEGRLSLATPFVGEMRVDPAFTDPSFGQIGRVTSITLSLPLSWRVPSFDTIVTQGPEISGITPLKDDVTLLNRDDQQVQVQFTTLQSSATYPGFGTPVGSLVDFSGGSFMQGSNSGPLDIGYGGRAVYLQNLRGRTRESRSDKDGRPGDGEHVPAGRGRRLTGFKAHSPLGLPSRLRGHR